jgi:RecJ-like exonuclease
MAHIDYLEFVNIDGQEYLPKRYHDAPRGYEECTVCDGTGEGVGYCICEECAGDGYVPNIDLAGWCINCERLTVNKAFGDFLCTQCDETRQTESINDPDRYEKTLFDK